MNASAATRRHAGIIVGKAMRPERVVVMLARLGIEPHDLPRGGLIKKVEGPFQFPLCAVERPAASRGGR